MPENYSIKNYSIKSSKEENFFFLSVSSIWLGTEAI